jgi:hypothetical protein
MIQPIYLINESGDVIGVNRERKKGFEKIWKGRTKVVFLKQSKIIIVNRNGRCLFNNQK